MNNFKKINSGTYAAISYSQKTCEQIEQIQKSLNLPFPVPIEKLHTTLVFSRKWIPYSSTKEKEFFIGCGSTLEIFEHNGKRALVMLIESEWCHERHQYGNILGATYDFPDYKPHITLSYDVGNMWFDLDQTFRVLLVAKEEYVEDLDLDWKP